jgi:glutamyl-tRNA reductase
VAPTPRRPTASSGGNRRKRSHNSASSRASPNGSLIVLVGTSFKTSSLAFREEMRRKLAQDSTRIRHLPGVSEYAELVTCNRIELLFATSEPEAVEGFFRSWLPRDASRVAIPGSPPPIYVLNGPQAIAHLFSVASGLDSMVLGEEQILGQVKEAGVKARATGSSRGTLSSLFDVSVSVGKRARKMTLARSPSSPVAPDDSAFSTSAPQQPSRSVSSAAIRFAIERLGRPPRRVLLIGTGKTTRLAAGQLVGADLFVATRRTLRSTFPNAKIVPHEDLARVAASCDLIVSATTSDDGGYLLSKKKGKNQQESQEGAAGVPPDSRYSTAGQVDDNRGRRVLIDLAFPRNIDPALGDDSTEVYDLDDLARILSSDHTPQEDESRPARELVLSEAERFSRWLLASRQTSALSQVYRWAEELRIEETQAALRRLSGLSPREKSIVEAMSKRLVSKLLASPTRFTKSSSPEFPQEQRLDIVRKIFEQGENE